MPAYNPETLSVIFASMLIVVIATMLPFIILRKGMSEAQHIQRRLLPSSDAGDDMPLIPRRKSLEKMGELVMPGNHKETSSVRSELSKAGYHDPSAIKVYFAIRALCLGAAALIVFVFYSTLRTKLDGNAFVCAITGIMALGLMAPKLYLRFRTNKLQLEYQNGFPDVMDLLVASLEAGLGLNAALLRVAEEIKKRYPALKYNIDLLNMELRAGRERHKAMSNFADRLHIQEARAMVVMLRQSEEMGSSLGTALRAFSEDMRHKRMMRAEEKAMALPAKLTVPLILFIFPALMVLLLMPAGIRIMAGLAE